MQTQDQEGAGVLIKHSHRINIAIDEIGFNTKTWELMMRLKATHPRPHHLGGLRRRAHVVSRPAVTALPVAHLNGDLSLRLCAVDAAAAGVHTYGRTFDAELFPVEFD